MRPKKFFALIFVFCILFFSNSLFGAEKDTFHSPVAYVPRKFYKFASVLEGTKITHDFIIQNRGTAPLKIEKVRSG